MVFCNFELRKDRGRPLITAVWNKKPIFKMGLTATMTKPFEEASNLEPAVVTHRYLPGLGPDTQPSADSIIQLARKTGPRVIKRYSADVYTMQFVNHNTVELPSLHRIIERLGELPILEAIEGCIVEGKGSPAFDIGREI